MKVNLITRFCIALLALHSLDAYCAMPPASQPTPARSIAVADPTATATPAGDAQNPAQQASQGLTPEPSHDVPAVVAAQGTSATPKEQAVALARDATADDTSGFRLMTLSTNALLSRVSLADQAKRSIDMQYYIFRNDATGRLIALHVLQAADRGVHVRILLDDLNLAEDVRMFDALDSHPNIEVRLFNPFHSRDPNPISKAAQFLLVFRRLKLRMHDKSFIVDNDVAVIGGPNIGDGYFDANVDTNFRDLDLLAIGPVVPAATASFEA